MKKQNVRTLSLIVCTLTYLLIGAAVFDSIESEEEKRQREALAALEKQMLAKYKVSSADYTMLEEVIQLEQPYKAGKPWKFAGSFYYATTVLTTIGYGHSTPKTEAGKFFTMVYAMIGIPLGLVMFNSIGERLNNFSSIVVTKVRRAVNARQAETTEMDLIGVVSSLSLIVVTTGAAAFSHYEGWSYFHSIYYCFVTLTTIGFGDYVALQQDNALETRPEYVAFALFFIMFGLAIIAASLNLMVLKFMTLNTEDEKRDEQQAIQDAANNVRLEGDIILQDEVLNNYQAEGGGPMAAGEDTRSVCSCTCQSCNPFQQVSALRRNEDHQIKPFGAALSGGGGQDRRNGRSRNLGGGPGTPRTWYSQTSILTSCTGGVENTPRHTRSGTPEAAATYPYCAASGPSPGPNCCDHSGAGRRERAESVHDLRRSTVSTALRVPPDTPPHMRRPASGAKTCCAAASRDRLGRDDRSISFALEAGRSRSELDGQRRPNSVLRSLFGWPKRRRRETAINYYCEDEDETERRESYALDEVDSGIKVVPLAKNTNHHKRVSL